MEYARLDGMGHILATLSAFHTQGLLWFTDYIQTFLRSLILDNN
jgi:hypothetical protein